MEVSTRKQLNEFVVERNQRMKNHPLYYVFWECTLRCNLACKHCGSDCYRDNSQADMPYQDFLKAFDQLRKIMNPEEVTVVIIGGEPLLREDIETIGLELKKRGFAWGIVTNGYELTRERFLALKEAGLKTISVSLDGMESSHNWNRNKNDSFQKAIRSIEYIVEHPDVVFDVITCMHQKNVHELAALKQLLIDLGVSHWRIATVFPKGRAKQNDIFSLHKETLLNVFEFIVATRNENLINLNYGCESFIADYELKIRDCPFFCISGVHVLSILLDGSISGCPSMRGTFSEGNIYHDNLAYVWQNGFKRYRNRNWTKVGICKQCKDFSYCNGGSLHLRNEFNELAYCSNKLINTKPVKSNELK